MDGEGRGTNDRISRGVSSNASKYNISKLQENVKDEHVQKGVISQSGVASFVYNDGSVKAIPHITEKDGMRIIGATKSIDENALVDGLWEDAPNTSKYTKNTDVEKSKMEN